MNQRLLQMTALASILCLAGVSLAYPERKVRYMFQVFRLSGDIQSKTSLEREIWQGSKSNWDKIKGSVSLFDRGEFRMGKDKLEISPRGCFWNDTKLTFEKGHKAKLPEEKIKMIRSPNILKLTKETVRIGITSNQPFQYLVRREDGLFELKEMQLPVGLDMEVCAHDKGLDVFLISKLDLVLRTVGHRERIEGVNLDIGRPVLQERTYRLRLFIDESKSYGIMLRPEGGGAIIIRMEVDDS